MEKFKGFLLMSPMFLGVLGIIGCIIFNSVCREVALYLIVIFILWIIFMVAVLGIKKLFSMGFKKFTGQDL